MVSSRQTVTMLFCLVLLAAPFRAVGGEEMTVVVGGDTLSGTLELPESGAPCPVALIIAGSALSGRRARVS